MFFFFFFFTRMMRPMILKDIFLFTFFITFQGFFYLISFLISTTMIFLIQHNVESNEIEFKKTEVNDFSGYILIFQAKHYFTISNIMDLERSYWILIVKSLVYGRYTNFNIILVVFL